MSNAPLSPRVPAAVGGSVIGSCASWALGVTLFGAPADAAHATEAIAAVPWPVLGVLIGGLTALAGWLPKDLASQLFDAADTTGYGAATGAPAVATSAAPDTSGPADTSLDDAINDGSIDPAEPA